MEATLGLVYESLEASRGDPVMFETAIDLASDYFYQHVEPNLLLELGVYPESGQFYRGELSEAWRLLDCTSDDYCSVEQYVEYTSSEFYDHEWEDIVARAEKLLVDIEAGNWQELGLK
ncbi:hypothetical protein [Congregibacter sp.]|jgi:hypothetical protein|uniref:hypothetical protein n=1 Tax=Congregibacter sp. TaxID=2744308 RepID=UPI0039E2D13B